MTSQVTRTSLLLGLAKALFTDQNNEAGITIDQSESRLHYFTTYTLHAETLKGKANGNT